MPFFLSFAKMDLQSAFPGLISRLDLASRDSSSGILRTVLVYLVGAACALYTLSSIYYISLHPLSKVPGPFLARFSSLWITWRYFRGNWHEDVVALHDKYGKAIRIGPNEVSVVDETTMKSIYSHTKNTPKTSWYGTWISPGGSASLFAVRDRKFHGVLRKRVSHSFSTSALMNMETYIHSCMDTFMEKMKKYSQLAKPVDMSVWTNSLTFDVIGELGYGEPFGHMETESDVLNLRATILDGFNMLSVVGYLPGQSIWVMNPLAQSFIASSPLNHFVQYTIQKLQSRKAENETGRRADLLTHWMNMKKADGEIVGDEEVLTEMFAIIGGGGDTTSILMRAVIFYVASTPSTYLALRKEIDDYCGDREFEDRILYRETQQMAFLQAVIKESARLWPSIVWQLPRDAPSGGITIDDKYFVPEGCQISISPAAQNRDVHIYGEDAKLFRPERWLENKARAGAMDSLSMTFGGNGPRACLGKNLALMETQLLLARLIRMFDFELVNKEQPWKVHAAWFASQNEMMIKVQRREQKHTPVATPEAA